MPSPYGVRTHNLLFVAIGYLEPEPFKHNKWPGVTIKLYTRDY